ncbi:MAG: MaoC family dehydratase [Myxococcales bacterium]|nr:MaoC family dehydratase [Myxococcales bacterium]
MSEDPTSPVLSGTRLAVGQSASITRSFSADEVVAFAALSGDDNPLHLDEAAAAADPRFGQRIVHGMFVASLFSALLGKRLPGPGTVYLGQNVSFRAPVFLGETITATVSVVAIRPDKPIATLTTTVTKADGTVCVKGEATVLIPSSKQ